MPKYTDTSDSMFKINIQLVLFQRNLLILVSGVCHCVSVCVCFCACHASILTPVNETWSKVLSPCFRTLAREWANDFHAPMRGSRWYRYIKYQFEFVTPSKLGSFNSYRHAVNFCPYVCGHWQSDELIIFIVRWESPCDIDMMHISNLIMSNNWPRIRAAQIAASRSV
jgi:hypothetical protein